MNPEKHLPKSEKGGEYIEHSDLAAETEHAQAEVDHAEDRVQRAALALSDPNKIIGPSGENGIQVLEHEMEEALREARQARDILAKYQNAADKTLH